MGRKIRIGAGAGFSGDRIEPAVELAEKGDLDYLCFECLAERTVGLAQLARLSDPEAGFDPFLERRLRAVLPPCRAKGVKIVTNMGAANPFSALHRTLQVTRELKIKGFKVAAVLGDDVRAEIEEVNPLVRELSVPVRSLSGRLVSANAYLGATPIVQALRGGAEMVLTGRVADPSLFLAPLMQEFGWQEDDWNRLGAGVVVGHLLECAGQLTGGYFADPSLKDVPELARLGFPLAEVSEDGEALFSKVPGSGGRLDRLTCQEQLLYEVEDPSSYHGPDVVTDFTGVTLEEIGPDMVKVKGGKGRERPRKLIVSLGVLEGYIGEGEITYAGTGAKKRAELAKRVLEERLKLIGAELEELRFDLIGINSAHGPASRPGPPPYEVRLRAVGRAKDKEEAAKVGYEIEALLTNGPAGGGGARRAVRDVLAIYSTLLPRELVHPEIVLEEA